jgi:UDP-N-acetylglucosamine 2-epimerase (non-hydrolysing)
MKVASLADAFRATGRIAHTLVHTGQHYDRNMSAQFFDDLGLPEPDLNLECGSGSHAAQTAEIMQRFEPVLQERKPDWVFVVGDVNSTVACALVAAKLHIRVAHVEAGLRSFDRGMPEEVNRVLTDRISDLLFVTEPAGIVNLQREGIAAEACYLVGDTMADTLLENLPRARQSHINETLGLEPRHYALLTLHRPANVDDSVALREILDGLAAIAADMPLLFPAHPRTAGQLKRHHLWERARSIAGLRLIDPLGYLDFLKLMSDAALVVTDSGGIQEETTILGVTCMTLRETTERPYTIDSGTNRLVKPIAADIRAAFREIRENPPGPLAKSDLTDGKAGERIARILLEWHARRSA